MKARAGLGLLVGLALAAAPAVAGASINDTVAAGPGGTAAFAWGSGVPVHIETRGMKADGTLDNRQAISWMNVDAANQRIGVDAAGVKLVAWSAWDPDKRAVYLRREAADGSLGPVVRLSAVGVHTGDVEMAVEPDGDATVAWWAEAGTRKVIQTRKRSANGALGPIRTLSSTAVDSFAPQLAATPGGAVTVVWRRDTAEYGPFLQTRTIRADGTLSELQRLTPVGQSAVSLGVAVSDQGAAVFSWTNVTGDIKTRGRSAAGALGTTQTVFDGAEFAKQPSMAGDRSGRVAYVWVTDVNETLVVKGRVRQPSGAFGPTFTLADGGLEPQAAFDASGNATFAWTSTEFSPARVIMARRRTVNGVLGMRKNLTGDTETANTPRVAVDAGGKATIAWILQGGYAGLHARTLTPSGALSADQYVEG